MQICNPGIITDSLAFMYDTGNIKSYKGGPTTELIPSPAVNCYPTYGNSWATCNTNHYSGGAYVSIGSIVSVVGNLVTTSVPHALRTFDVVQPQTTGGGVTATVNYFVKAVSTTSFTLHTYVATEDGSLGYFNPATGMHKCHDDIANDVRISINATSFPTMWWGYPHLPNSGLVKEIIPNGYNNQGQIHDCIRLHYDRPDGVTDGMAYGVYPTVTPGTPVTVTFWARAVNKAATVGNHSFQVYNYTGGNAASYNTWFTLEEIGVWKRVVHTFTPAYGTLIFYWFPPSGLLRLDIAHIHVGQQDYPSDMTLTSRAATQCMFDLTNNSTIDLTDASFDATGDVAFNGTTSKVVATNTQLNHRTADFTYECVAKWYVNGTWNTLFENGYYYGGILIRHTASSIQIFSGPGNYVGSFALSPTVNQWYHLTFTRVGSSLNFYINGDYNSSMAFTEDVNLAYNYLSIGSSQHVGGQVFNGKIPMVKVYNKALSSTDIQQNFQAIRGRFGL